MLRAVDIVILSWQKQDQGRLSKIQTQGADPEHTGRVTYSTWPGNTSPRKSWRTWLGKRTYGLPQLACCHCNLDPDKWQKMDRWRNITKTIKSLSSFVPSVVHVKNYMSRAYENIYTNRKFNVMYIQFIYFIYRQVCIKIDCNE